MKRSWMIGTAESCDIQLRAPFVSGEHCRLSCDGKKWALEDLGSTNGTFVNGKRLEGICRISRSDVVTLGRTQPLPWPDVQDEAGRQSTAVELPSLGNAIVIGRASDCDVILDFPMISSRHAEIRHSNEGWVVRDLGSTNGTFFEGRRISVPVIVRPGSVIGLGTYQFTLAAEGTRLIEHDRRGSTVMEANNIAVDVPGRRLIEQLTMVVQPGEMVAIMGPSGAGKSTLLAALVGYQPPSEGRVSVSGIDMYAHFDELRGQIGYVPQDDIMHTDLTVEQALWYSARLRLPCDYSDTEIRKRVATVVAQLGLEGTENTRIGSADRRGISGGQRKRVNAGMELLTDPPILVLDEPTSGLSSNDSLMLVRLLRELADSGKTIVLTIHQPSIDVLKLMDGLAVVARDDSTANVGNLVWYGPAYPDAAHFFEPRRPAGHPPEAEAVLRGLERGRVAEWLAAYRKTAAYEAWVAGRTQNRKAETPGKRSLGHSLFEAVGQLRVLVQRTLAVKWADTWNTVILLTQAPAIALLIVFVFGKKTTTDLDAENWSQVAGSLGMTCFLLALSGIWFGCSNSVREVVAEKAIYRRERMVGLGLHPYLLAKLFVLGLLCLVQCAVLLAVVGIGCGLKGEWPVMFLVLFLAASVGVVMGLCVSSVVRTAEAAAAILPLLILPLVILGGALLPIKDLPPTMEVVADAMPSRWAFEGIIVNEAAAHAVLELPQADNPATMQKQDVAERWFPERGWRSPASTPPLVLLGMWLLGLFMFRWSLVRKEG